jgi:hypothetical protein
MPDETIIDKLFINTVITTGYISPPIKPVENDKYRFYHLGLNGMGFLVSQLRTLLYFQKKTIQNFYLYQSTCQSVQINMS